MVEGAVWVMGRGRCASCAGALGWKKVPVRGYRDGAVICMGSTWTGAS
jgi:hypothetical protein